MQILVKSTKMLPAFHQVLAAEKEIWPLWRSGEEELV